ncbi:cuticle protein 16.5-like [Sergentomyia squamirostris]
MLTKIVIFVLVAVLGTFANAGVIAPYASSYNAHTINHAVAHPILASAAPAPYIAAAPAPAAPFIAPAASPYVAPSPYFAPSYARAPFLNPLNPYSALPYSAYPYLY